MIIRRLPIILLLTLFAFFASNTALAAPYFEFAPDYLQSLLPAISGTPSEVFLPLNDYLSGFDIWLSNDNTTGSATFTLQGPNGQQVSSRTVSLPAIADTEGGTAFHVNLPSQIAVVGNAPYELRIQSSIPGLKLYYAPQVRLLPLNGMPPPAYTGGLARLNGEDQGYSFAFGLYESPETTAPVISNVSTSQDAIDKVIFTFNANEPVDYRIHYGSELIDWSGGLKTCLPGVHNCVVTLPVQPAKRYDYTLTAKDSWGNESSYDGSFVSLDNGQTPTPISPSPSAKPSTPPESSVSPTPPSVITITNARAVNLQARSASFAWTTSGAANSTVVVQLTPVLITIGGNSDATLELEHYVTVNGLIPDTYYAAAITSTDGNGQSATAKIQLLTTRDVPSPSPTAPPTTSGTPTPSALTSSTIPTPSVSPAGGDLISWTGPVSGEPGNGYRIDVFDSNNNLIRSARVPAGTHSTNLALPAGDNRVIVYSDNNGVYQKVAVPMIVKTPTKPLLEQLWNIAPYILAAIVLTIALFIVILWYRHKKSAQPKALTTPTPHSG